jgi:hypothetical protein
MSIWAFRFASPDARADSTREAFARPVAFDASPFQRDAW